METSTTSFIVESLTRAIVEHRIGNSPARSLLAVEGFAEQQQLRRLGVPEQARQDQAGAELRAQPKANKGHF